MKKIFLLSGNGAHTLKTISLNAWSYGFLASFAWTGIGLLFLTGFTSLEIYKLVFLCVILGIVILFYRNRIGKIYTPFRKLLLLVLLSDGLWSMMLIWQMINLAVYQEPLSIALTLPWKLLILSGGLVITVISACMAIFFMVRNNGDIY